MSKAIRGIALLVFGAAVWMMSSGARAQIVINEVVEDEQDFESTDINPDTREFVELYNAGSSPVNIGDYTLNYYMLTGGTGTPVPGAYFATFDTIPTGTILAPGDYWVVGSGAVPNVDQNLGTNIDLFPNSTTAQGGTIFELWNGDRTVPGKVIVDAVAMDTFRNSELANASQAQLDQIAAGQTVGANARGGWWGQVESNNAHPTDTGPNSPVANLPMSLGRYKDGYDHNVNGRDFGMIPATPGTANNLAQVAAHVVTNVDSLAPLTALRDDYYASFKLPRVIDPTVQGPAIGANRLNPNAIPVSPQGGKAIISWDETGGGNVAYSDEYSNEFKIYAYIDPTPFNNTTASSTQSEATTYGLAGSSDVFFSTPNSGGLLTGQLGTGGNITSSANGNTGLGWMIQRRTSTDAGNVASSAAILQLVDFNDGGDGVLADNDWQIKHSLDMTGMSAGWHVLGIKYDPVTGNVTAVFDSTTVNFATTTDLVGNFYIGYREQLPGTGGNNGARPPTYDLFVAPAGVAGDFNSDGKVDAGDYATWRKNAGNAALPNDNGLTTQAARFTLWRSAFGTPGSGSGSLDGGAVPEPATAVLALFGLVACLAGRRRTA